MNIKNVVNFIFELNILKREYYSGIFVLWLVNRQYFQRKSLNRRKKFCLLLHFASFAYYDNIKLDLIIISIYNEIWGFQHQRCTIS